MKALTTVSFDSAAFNAEITMIVKGLAFADKTISGILKEKAIQAIDGIGLESAADARTWIMSLLVENGMLPKKTPVGWFNAKTRRPADLPQDAHYILDAGNRVITACYDELKRRGVIKESAKKSTDTGSNGTTNTDTEEETTVEESVELVALRNLYRMYASEEATNCLNALAVICRERGINPL